MNSQNILKNWKTYFKLKLDTSEYYDYELTSSELDYDSEAIDFSNEIIFTGLTIDSSCINNLDSIKPWQIEINVPYTDDACDFTVRKRTELGWTLDFVFNRNTLPWSSGYTFYYWGILDETDPQNYLDNNLSFSFTNDGRIKWEKYHLSGYCETVSGYTEVAYISSGQTSVLCTGGTSNDFNITIVYRRHNELFDCDIKNRGGINDYITGYTVTNPRDVISGATENIEMSEVLNKNWLSNRFNRLGTLKIYLNGRLVSKFLDWEEIVPSNRQSENIIAQVFGGGTNNSGGIHSGTTEFELLQVKYFEEPLNFPRIKHHYITSIKPYFTINECNDVCTENIVGFFPFSIITEYDELLTTEDNVLILY
jgi:hypothetical protein